LQQRAQSLQRVNGFTPHSALESEAPTSKPGTKSRLAKQLLSPLSPHILRGAQHHDFAVVEKVTTLNPDPPKVYSFTLLGQNR
jgi:hypothetical protein